MMVGEIKKKNLIQKLVSLKGKHGFIPYGKDFTYRF